MKVGHFEVVRVKDGSYSYEFDSKSFAKSRSKVKPSYKDPYDLKVQLEVDSSFKESFNQVLKSLGSSLVPFLNSLYETDSIKDN